MKAILRTWGNEIETDEVIEIDPDYDFTDEVIEIDPNYDFDKGQYHPDNEDFLPEIGSNQSIFPIYCSINPADHDLNDDI